MNSLPLSLISYIYIFFLTVFHDFLLLPVNCSYLCFVCLKIFCELVVWRILRVINFTLSPHAQVV